MTDNPFEKYFNPQNLELAYYRIVCWPERMVKDRFGIHSFGAQLDKNLKQLSEKLISEKYTPQRGFKYYEPKSSGTQRTKTLLMIEDALVYQAIANVIAERNYDLLAEHDDFVFGSILMPDSKEGTNLLKQENPKYFFFKFWKSLFIRFKDSVIKAIERDKATHKFETDITGFFDSIPHYNLLLTLSTHFKVEDEILDLLSVCLNAWSGTKESSTPGVGIPQGPQPSYLLANLLLYPLDKQLISEAFKYYRYMDDIKIYGYSESELRNVLVLIDNYLKGNGLSINSKKTGITLIDAANEDETVKELRRFEVVGNDYTGDETFFIELSGGGLESNVIKSLLSLSEQSPEEKGESDVKKHLENITDTDKIIEFWEKEVSEVEKELPALFKSDSLELANPEKTDDIDLIRLSAKYGTALRSLSEYKQVKANDELLPYWLFALKKYYWRASNYVLTLQHYRGNTKLREELISIYLTDKNYECYRYHVIICLTYNFEYIDRELREFFKYLKAENSELVRYALYCMLIKHSDDQQLKSTLKVQLSKESSNYLKLITLDYWKKDTNRVNSMDELVKQMGL
ncbi:MAG: RNA-directed DNA polymerase [Bacteroidia bacterium]|nr:RNA-directed DNA polymerase [Bacteroidia bacterium]